MIGSTLIKSWYGRHRHSLKKMLNHSPATTELPHSPYHHKGTEMTEDSTARYELPISNDDKATILLNVEGAVKDLASALAKKQEIKGTQIDPSLFASLPNSLTGVMVHYFIKGIRDDFDIEFTEKPVSLKQRSTNPFDKKVAGKKRLLTREQKNELLSRTQMSFYEMDIAAGKMTLDQAMVALKDAYEKKANFEGIGYVLPAKKTEYPYWADEAA